MNENMQYFIRTIEILMFLLPITGTVQTTWIFDDLERDATYVDISYAIDQQEISLKEAQRNNSRNELPLLMCITQSLEEIGDKWCSQRLIW